MKNITTLKGKLEIIGRLDTSLNGNPRYKMLIDGLYCVTAVDSMLGYSVTNYDGKKVIASVGLHYGKPTLNSLKGA